MAQFKGALLKNAVISAIVVIVIVGASVYAANIAGSQNSSPTSSSTPNLSSSQALQSTTTTSSSSSFTSSSLFVSIESDSSTVTTTTSTTISSSSSFSASSTSSSLHSTSTSSSSQPTVLIYGVATMYEGNGQCGGGYIPTGVIFGSSDGKNHTASFTNSGQSSTGNYSANLPDNDQYSIYVQWSHDCFGSIDTGSCTAGTFNLNASPDAKVELNVECGQAPSVTTVTSTSTSSSSSYSTSSAKVISTIANIHAIYLTCDVSNSPNLYAFGLGQATQSIIDTRSNSVSQTNVAEQPIVDPNTGYATLLGTSGNANLGASTAKWVAVYNPVGQLVANVTSPIVNAGEIYGLAYDPQNNHVYMGVFASSAGPSNITIIDAATNKEVGGINTLSNTWLGLTYYNGYLYNVISPVNGRGGPATVQVINTTSNTIINTVGIGAATPPVVNPSSGEVYLAGYDNVTVTNPTLNPIKVIPLSAGSAEWTAYDPNINQLYISTGSNSVSVIDTQTNTVVQTLQVGKAPGPVVFDPQNGLIYVLNEGDQSISVIQP